MNIMLLGLISSEMISSYYINIAVDKFFDKSLDLKTVLIPIWLSYSANYRKIASDDSLISKMA